MNRRFWNLLILAVGIAALLALLTGASPGYRRLDWKHWADLPGSCQSVRTAVLIRDAVKDTIRLSPDGCRVESGEWIDPYTGAKIHDPTRLQVDHLVPLHVASDSGGAAWSPDKKRAYANDLTYARHLVTTLASVNQEKGDRGPERWRPPNPAAACWYAEAWATVKFSWNLRATAQERAAVRGMLATCGPVGRESLP